MAAFFANYPPIVVSGGGSGGATAANQVLEIAQLTAINSNTVGLATQATLASIDGKTPVLGQAVASASVPVVLPAAQITALTPPTTVTVTQATGSNLHVAVDSLPSIPAGSNAIGSITNTSFAATQATASLLNATVIGTTAAGSGSASGLVTVQGNASGTPIPVSGTITVSSTTANQGTPAATANAWPIKVTDGTNSAAIQTVNSVNRLAVTLAAGSATGATAPAYTDVIGGVDTATGFAQQLQVDTSKNLKVNLQTALPAGTNSIGGVTASYSDTTATGTITTTQSVAISTAGIATVGFQITGTWTGSIVLEGTVDGTNWAATSGVALTSGTSFATFTANNAGQVSTSGLSQIRLRGNTVATGTATITLRGNATTAIVMLDAPLPSGTNTIGAISNTAFGSKIAGLAVANAPVYNVYSSTNITTAAYTQLIASTTSATQNVQIFDSSGQGMILAVGAPGSEVIQAYVQPGGDAFQLSIPAGSRVAYKALTANATAGYLLINLLG